jgi:hypothetical protein
MVETARQVFGSSLRKGAEPVEAILPSKPVAHLPILADVVLLLSGNRSDALKRAELDHLRTHTLKGP